jgi:type 1 fimbriae regulatory protein FimB/type 1 fimbriae regulatory protein FimE
MTERLKVNRSRASNDNARGRKHLLPDEVERIGAALRDGSRYPVRDELMVLMAFTHGLRVSERVALPWQQVNLKTRQLKVERLKGSISSTHPIVSKRESMLLKRLHKAAGEPRQGYLFNTERGTPVSRNGFQKLFTAYSEKALGQRWNPHALRHGCGTDLVDQDIHLAVIQNYMGHANVQNTVQYLHGSSKQFQDIRF